MRRVALAALIACSSRSGAVPHVAARRAPPLARVPVHVQHGSHSTPIVRLAASDDGSAALTQDASGGTRLWRSLDGTREPVVVELDEARALALHRLADGYAIAAIDEGTDIGSVCDAP